MFLKDPWQERAAKVTTIFFGLLIFTSFIALGIFFKDLVKIFVFGLLINYLLSKPVSFLTRFIKFRALAIFITFFVIISFFFVVGNNLYPIFEEQLQELAQSLPHIRIQIYNFMESINLSREKIIALVNNTFNENGFYQIVSISLLKSIDIITSLVLTIIVSFYLLLDGERLWNLFVSAFPKSYEKHLAQIKIRMDANLYSLVVGQFQIATLTASVMLITYIFLANPFALLLASLQMLEFIPVLGTWIAIIPSILIILTTSGSQKAIIAASVYLIYTQIIRDQIIAPRIMSAAFGIHPLLVIFGLLIGIQIFGLVGIVVSLPIIAIISAIMDYLFLFKDKN